MKPADQLQSWLEQAGIRSDRELAQRAGVGKATIQRLRKQEAQYIPAAKLQAIATVLQCSPLALLAMCSPLNWGNPQLEAEYSRLQRQLKQQPQHLQQQFQEQTYRQLETLLTQLPTAQYLAHQDPQRLAHHVTPLFIPLQQLLARWQIQPIGTVAAQVAFDPQSHQGSEALTPGELVYIRFVGYRTPERLLHRAQVSRTNPFAPPN